MSRRTEGPTLIIVNETVSEAMAFLDVLDAQLKGVNSRQYVVNKHDHSFVDLGKILMNRRNN